MYANAHRPAERRKAERRTDPRIEAEIRHQEITADLAALRALASELNTAVYEFGDVRVLAAWRKGSRLIDRMLIRLEAAS